MSQVPDAGSAGPNERGAAPQAPSLTLTSQEIFEITGYRRAHEQLAWFKALGVPARRRADGTVSAREHYLRASIRFESKKERDRYRKLMARARTGEITTPNRQVRFAARALASAASRLTDFAL